MSEATGTSLEDLCKRQAFHDNFPWFAETTMRDEWAPHFPGEMPTSMTPPASGPLVMPDANIALDRIGYIPGR
jgi:hypothetical protein